MRLRAPRGVQAALDRQSLLVRCVLEALRLRGPGIDVRFCSTDVTMPRGEGPPVVIPRVSLPVSLHSSTCAYLCRELDHMLTCPTHIEW